jgi:hypothetical protein
MEHNLIETLTEQLRKQRKHYLEAFRKAEEGLESIAAEREANWKSMLKKNNPHGC